jgi:phospholipid transport system substrate-binding protein
MKTSSTPIQTDPGRRAFLRTSGAAVLALVVPAGAARAAFGLEEARALIDRAIGEVNATINSGKSETAMFADFERIFVDYADVTAIARSALGPVARSTPDDQMKAYTRAFRGYIARKYGRRFREFIGSRIEVTGAQPVRSYFEVLSTVQLRGQAPFDVRWHVSDKGGRPMFFNIIIEGVNMLAAERTEIGALLDANGRSITALTSALDRI